jgi:ABC transporter with metal-binding/Fe-S-binding domain ATP-binding protein
MKLAVLYSGGKDSNYALFKMYEDNQIMCLINLDSENPNSYMFQSVGNEIVGLQSKSLSIPLIKYKTKGEKEKELIDLKNAIKNAINKYQIEGIVTGAIKSAYQSSRIQKICYDLEIECFNPIWQIDEDEFLNELILNKFQISIFGIFSYPFTKEYIGQIINLEFLKNLNKLKDKFQISIAGEGGEYESLVLDSPLFKKKIQIKDIEIESESENSAIISKCEATLIEK